MGLGEYMLILHEPEPGNGRPSTSRPSMGPHSHAPSIFHPTASEEEAARDCNKTDLALVKH